MFLESCNVSKTNYMNTKNNWEKVKTICINSRESFKV